MAGIAARGRTLDNVRQLIKKIGRRLICLFENGIQHCWGGGHSELQKSHGYAGITREEGLQHGQSVRKVSCQHTT